MRTHIGLIALIAAALAGSACADNPASPAAPAGAPTTRESPEGRLQRLESRLDSMEKRHAAELEARDAEIAALKAQISHPSPATAPSKTEKSTADALNAIDSAGTKPATRDSIEKARSNAFRDIDSNLPLTLTPRTAISFNPDIAVVSDFVGSLSTLNINPARNRLDVREVELDLRAAVDPRADAVAVLPFSREIEDPLFFHGKEDSDGEVNTSIDVEEAYLSLHDFGVPNLTAKLGRFHLRFGRWNILHKHDWVTTDNTFVNQSFLGEESITDQGLSLSWVAPPSIAGNEYFEGIAEILSGDGNEGPVLNNTGLFHSPALNLHVLWNHDFGAQKDWNVELGASALLARRNDDDQQRANLFGFDATLIHTDPTGRFNNQLFMFEADYGDVDAGRNNRQHALGAFLVAQQQLDRDWYVGVRGDWTQNALNDNEETWAGSAYATWYWSEFLRFRLEFQHKSGDVRDENTVFLQATWIIGAHPPHPYYAVK